MSKEVEQRGFSIKKTSWFSRLGIESRLVPAKADEFLKAISKKEEEQEDGGGESNLERVDCSEIHSLTQSVVKLEEGKVEVDENFDLVEKVVLEVKKNWWILMKSRVPVEVREIVCK